MKQFSSIPGLSLVLATGTALAADPPKPTTKPAATTQTMGHGKMDMQQGQMNHGRMDISGKKPADHQQMANDEFAALDKNKDGCLSKAEFAKHHGM